MTIQITVSRNSFNLPSVSDRLLVLRAPIKNLISSTYHFALSAVSSTGAGTHAVRFHQFRRQFKKNKFFFIPVAIIVILILAGVFMTLRNAGSSPSGVAGASNTGIELREPLATQSINKTFTFPLKDSEGKNVSNIEYTIESAELRDEIIISGRRASLVNGRVFLILPIKITNSYNQLVTINARDYIRLIVNNNTNEKYAPDISIEKDPVEVQAISTKRTRVGFPIDENAKSLTLQVGEINGKKQDIKLTLKR